MSPINGLRVRFSWTTNFITFGPSTLTLLERPLWYYRSVQFDIFGPSSLILSDRPVWHFGTVQFETFGPSSLTLSDRPLLVEWPSTLTHDRPLWLKRPSTIVLDRPLWLKWPSGLAQDRPLLDRPSTFARPSTLRTVHFHPFGPSTLDQTRSTRTVLACYNKISFKS